MVPSLGEISAGDGSRFSLLRLPHFILFLSLFSGILSLYYSLIAFVCAATLGTAVAGGAAGAVVGGTAAPPTEVRTYVAGQTVAPVTYSGQVVVGQPIAGEVTWLEVPSYPKYRWAYLNGQRVVVDANTHAVVAVY